MNRTLTARDAAEAIEKFGIDLADLSRSLDRLCERLPPAELAGVNAIPAQDTIDAIALRFCQLGQRLSAECDEAEEADDRRRANPLERDYRRYGA